MNVFEDLLEPLLAPLGYELVEIETSPKGRTVRVFIDAPAKPQGIDVDDCERVSHIASDALEAAGIDYERLEVSSPGVDRVLNRDAHFLRFVGEQASFKLRQPMGTRRNFVGRIEGCRQGQVSFECEGATYHVPLDNIQRARLQPTLDFVSKQQK